MLFSSFNVFAYDGDDSWATTLCIGKVEMTDVHTRESIELLPGRQAVCDRQTGNVEVKEVDILPYVTWKEGHFLFKNQSLEKIMDIMARWYDVSVEFQDESIRNLHFTGDIKRHANLSIILKALTSSVNVNYKLNGRELILYMK